MFLLDCEELNGIIYYGVEKCRNSLIMLEKGRERGREGEEERGLVSWVIVVCL